MEMTMRLPANYNVMNEEEMTYTSGGAFLDSVVIGGFALSSTVKLVVGGLIVYNFVDCLIDARDWYKANKTGDLINDLGNGVNALGDYVTSSAWNCVRGVLATAAALNPLGLAISGLAFITV